MITIKAKFASSFLDRNLGLLRQKNKGKVLLFKTRFGIHTFFLKEPIDVLVLETLFRRAAPQILASHMSSGNTNQFTIITSKTILPNKIFLWNPKYCWCLELPKGSIKKLGLAPGNRLKLTISDLL